jgi:hypothetical protein
VPDQADSRNLRPAAVAPTKVPVREVRDIAVVPTRTDAATGEDFRVHPPASGVQLGRGLTIERLSNADYALLMASCVARGHYFFAVPQWGQRYAFVRRVPLEDYEANKYGWDDDHTLSYALQMSRLIRDNSHCSEFAARIVDHEDDEQQVIPLASFDARLAFRYGRERDWLDAGEADELRDLLTAFWQVEPDWPARVQRAMRHCERASQLPFFQESQPRLVTALEAILNTSTSHVSKQFRERVPALAAELGIDGISKRMADRQYEARSQAYHGGEVRLFSGHPGSAAPELTEPEERVLAETRLLQQVIRRAMRLAIEDASIRDLLGDESAVRERFPVRVQRWWRSSDT